MKIKTNNNKRQITKNGNGNGKPEPIVGNRGASIMGPRNVPIEGQNPDALHTDRRNQPGSFDPVGFTVVPPRRFEDLRVGDVFRAPSRTLTDAHASAFQTVSADNHPIHYDVEYARRHGHTAPVVHGLQVLAFTAPGATLFPQYIGDVFVAFTSASCRFLKEVHAGDTLYPQLEITKLTTQGDTGIVTTRATVHNQRGELVLDGEHTYSLKAASADEK